VEIQVVEGSFVEVPTADGRGVDRRAFGEFISHRGELASYAFGWTTGSEPHVARLSIGIGVGNPGGATFHAVASTHEDGPAFTLVDEPFEDVPEGGPDLTADQARAHDTLPFIWWVADTVMERDRRARWMRHWLLGTSSTQTHEVFERREPVLLVVNEASDGSGSSSAARTRTAAPAGSGTFTTPSTTIRRCSTSSTCHPATALAVPTSANPGPAFPRTWPDRPIGREAQPLRRRE
jgi:hypothetical protein